jgi:hypothetical protein
MRVFIPYVLATQITSLTILKSEVCGLETNPEFTRMSVPDWINSIKNQRLIFS